MKDDVYQIASGAELAWFAKKINESTGATLKAILIKDVDLGDQLWTPIGDKLRSEFKGEFDGNGKTVSGLKIETDQPDWALFGHVTSGTVKNLTVKGSVKSTSTNTISNPIIPHNHSDRLYTCKIQKALFNKKFLKQKKVFTR